MNPRAYKVALGLSVIIIVILGGIFYSTNQNQLNRINDLESTRKNLLSQISDLNTSLANLSSTVEALQSERTALQNKINGLNTQVSSLNGTVNTLQGNISSLNAQISDLNARTRDLNSTLNLQKSQVLLIEKVVPQDQHSETVALTFQPAYPGYLNISMTSTSDTAYIVVRYLYGEPLEFKRPLGTSGLCIVPVLPPNAQGQVTVSVGNTNLYGIVVDTISVTYFY